MTGHMRGDRLLALREAMGQSQAQVAAAVGVNRSMITKMEGGAKLPSLATLLALATYFEVSPDYLLGWSDARRPGLGEELPESVDQRAISALIEGLPREARGALEDFLRNLTRDGKRDNAA